MYQGVATTSFVKPDIVTSHFHLREGDRVADFGTGAGHFVPALARAVGDAGRVYALDVQKGLVENVGALASERRLSNTSALLADLEHPGGIPLDDGILDAGLLVNTLFQLQDKKVALEEMARVLRKGAKLFVIDWVESFGGIGPHPESVIPPARARTVIEEAGFACERDIPAGEHHYALACRKL